MIPLLIPHSQRQNILLQQSLPYLQSNFQIREIQDSPSTPGDIVFPSLGIACLFYNGENLDGEGNLDDLILRVANIIQRRRCLILVTPAQQMADVQLR